MIHSGTIASQRAGNRRGVDMGCSRYTPDSSEVVTKIIGRKGEEGGKSGGYGGGDGSQRYLQHHEVKYDKHNNNENLNIISNQISRYQSLPSLFFHRQLLWNLNRLCTTHFTHPRPCAFLRYFLCQPVVSYPNRSFAAVAG